MPLILWTVYVEEEGWGISRWLGVVGWFEIITSVVVLDFFDYLWHRANHRVRFLWRFHKTHHAVDQRYGNADFSPILSVWDRLFGTYVRPADDGSTTRGPDALGLPEARDLAFSPRAWLTEPFARRNLDLNRRPLARAAR